MLMGNVQVPVNRHNGWPLLRLRLGLERLPLLLLIRDSLLLRLGNRLEISCFLHALQLVHQARAHFEPPRGEAAGQR